MFIYQSYCLVTCSHLLPSPALTNHYLMSVSAQASCEAHDPDIPKAYKALSCLEVLTAPQTLCVHDEASLLPWSPVALLMTGLSVNSPLFAQWCKLAESLHEGLPSPHSRATLEPLLIGLLSASRIPPCPPPFLLPLHALSALATVAFFPLFGSMKLFPHQDLCKRLPCLRQLLCILQVSPYGFPDSPDQIT